MFSNQFITYERLKELRSRSDLSYLERLIMEVPHCVYLIHSDSLNRSYIGETDNDIYYRVFDHWRNPHIKGHLPNNFDSSDTYIELLESDCDNRSREFFWHEEHKRLFPEVDLISSPGRFGMKGHSHKLSDHDRRRRSGAGNPSYGKILYYNKLTGEQRRFPKSDDPGADWIKGTNPSNPRNYGFNSEACKEASKNSPKHRAASIENLKSATEKGRIKWVFLGDKGYMIRYSQWNGRKIFNAKKVCKLSDWEDYCSQNGLNPNLIHYKTNNE